MSGNNGPHAAVGFGGFLLAFVGISPNSPLSEGTAVIPHVSARSARADCVEWVYKRFEQISQRS